MDTAKLQRLTWKMRDGYNSRTQVILDWIKNASAQEVTLESMNIHELELKNLDDSYMKLEENCKILDQKVDVTADTHTLEKLFKKFMLGPPYL